MADCIVTLRNEMYLLQFEVSFKQRTKRILILYFILKFLYQKNKCIYIFANVYVGILFLRNYFMLEFVYFMITISLYHIYKTQHIQCYDIIRYTVNSSSSFTIKLSSEFTKFPVKLFNIARKTTLITKQILTYLTYFK